MGHKQEKHRDGAPGASGVAFHTKIVDVVLLGGVTCEWQKKAQHNAQPGVGCVEGSKVEMPARGAK